MDTDSANIATNYEPYLQKQSVNQCSKTDDQDEPSLKRPKLDSTNNRCSQYLELDDQISSLDLILATVSALENSVPEFQREITQLRAAQIEGNSCGHGLSEFGLSFANINERIVILENQYQYSAHKKVINNQSNLESKAHF